mgnify:CR=1 FL=1
MESLNVYASRLVTKREYFAPGHRACQGCAEALAVRLVAKAMGQNVVVASATGCMEIISSPFPFTNWRVPWIHVAFENAAAVATGAEGAYRALVRKGARGVVRKHREADHLGTAIRKVSAGEIWLSRGGLSRLVDDMATSADVHPHPPQRGGAFMSLTEREREVAALIAEGLHNRAIAARLGITENTVRHHLTAIYGKLGVADRLELAVHALRHRTGVRSRKA